MHTRKQLCTRTLLTCIQHTTWDIKKRHCRCSA